MRKEGEALIPPPPPKTQGIRPKLTEQQKEEFKAVFKLMDGGSAWEKVHRMPATQSMPTVLWPMTCPLHAACRGWVRGH